MGIEIYIVGLVLYYALHSLLAANSVKQALQKVIPPKYYRIFYNLTAVILLVGIAGLFLTITQTLLLILPAWLRIMTLIVSGLGLLVVALAMRNYNLREFAGLETQDLAQNDLQIKGLNSWVRHPLYLGILIMVWGLFLSFATDLILATAVISSLYIPVGIYFEEKKLIAEFGEAYLQYRKEVKMLIPFIF